MRVTNVYHVRADREELNDTFTSYNDAMSYLNLVRFTLGTNACIVPESRPMS